MADERRKAVALEVRNRDNGRVDWELLIIGAETVAVGIRIREQPTLQDWVRAKFDAGYDVGRRKCGLLDLRKVILRVLVQYELADGAEREILVWPNFGQVQNIVAECLCFLRRHRLLGQMGN